MKLAPTSNLGDGGGDRGLLSTRGDGRRAAPTLHLASRQQRKTLFTILRPLRDRVPGVRVGRIDTFRSPAMIAQCRLGQALCSVLFLRLFW